MSRMNEASSAVKLFDVIGFNPLSQACLTIGTKLAIDAAISRAHGFNAAPSRQITAVVLPVERIKSETEVDLDLQELSDRVEASSVDSGACSCQHDSDATQGSEDAADGESCIDFSEDVEDEPQKRSFRVTLMRGDGSIDILPGFFTEAEAKAEAARYEDIEAVDVAYQLKGLGSQAEQSRGFLSPATKSQSTATRYDIDELAYRFRGESIRNAFRVHWEHIGRHCIELIEDASDLGHIAKSLQSLCDALGHEDNFLAGWHATEENWQMIVALGFEDEPAKRETASA